MRISVIIPHLNQPESLALSLEALADQTDPGVPFEVIVVDNGSAALPAGVCRKFPNVRLFEEAVPGPGPARNKGVAEATGDILAFIDADCRAERNWLATIARTFGESAADVVGGDVQVPFENPANPRPLECYERVYAYRNQRYIASGFSVTANLAMRRSVFSAVGPFAGIDTAEDREWCARARSAGFGIRYVQDMVVFHPARNDFGELQRKWDRHIMHDFQHVAGFSGKIRWVGRALAVGASPLFEAFRIATTRRLSGVRQRWRAFATLLRIRLYRCARMLMLMASPRRHSVEKVWNRE